MKGVRGMPVGECNLALGSWVRDGLIPSSLCTVHLHSESRTVKSETAQPTQSWWKAGIFNVPPPLCGTCMHTYKHTKSDYYFFLNKARVLCFHFSKVNIFFYLALLHFDTLMILKYQLVSISLQPYRFWLVDSTSYITRIAGNKMLLPEIMTTLWALSAHYWSGLTTYQLPLIVRATSMTHTYPDS